jgi:large subunit ribosomal protein L29
MKATDLREKTVEDLRELQASLAHDVFQNRLKNFTNRLDDTSAIRKTKRDLARVITLLHQRSAPAGVAVASADKAEKATAVAAPSAPAEAVAVAAPAEKAPKKKTSKKSEAKQS